MCKTDIFVKYMSTVFPTCGLTRGVKDLTPVKQRDTLECRTVFTLPYYRLTMATINTGISISNTNFCMLIRQKFSNV